MNTTKTKLKRNVLKKQPTKKKLKKISVYDLTLKLRFASRKSAEKARLIILKCLNEELKEIPKKVLFPDENIEGMEPWKKLSDYKKKG